jgi:hypothetical protein
VHGEPVDPAVERLARLVVAHAAVELVDLVAGDVRRVRDDQVERLRVDQPRERLEEVARFDGDAIG